MLEKYPKPLEDVEGLRFQIARLKYAMSVELNSIPEDGILQTPEDAPDVERKENVDFTVTDNEDQVERGSGESGERGENESLNMAEERTTPPDSAGGDIAQSPLSDYLEADVAEMVSQWKMKTCQRNYIGLQNIACGLISDVDKKTEEKGKNDQFVDFLMDETLEHNSKMITLKLEMYRIKDERKTVEEERDTMRVDCKTNELNAIITQNQVQELEEQNEQLRSKIENLERVYVPSAPLEKKLQQLEDDNKIVCDKKKQLLEKLRGLSRVGVNRRLEEAQLRAQKSDNSFGAKDNAGTQTEVELPNVCDNCNGVNVDNGSAKESNTPSPRVTESAKNARVNSTIELNSENLPKHSVKSIFSDLKKRIVKKFSKSQTDNRKHKSSCWSGICNLFRDKNKVRSFSLDD